MRRKIVLLAALAALGAAACGVPPTVAGPAAEGPTEAEGVFASFDGMASGERKQALVAAAEDEGAVTAYLRSDEVGPEIEAAFESTYDVDLTILNPGTPTVVRQKVLDQARAGQVRADLVETYAYELETIYAENGIVAEAPAFLGNEVSDPNLVYGSSLEIFQYPFFPSWNTNRVPEGERPASYEDLRDPAWQDSLVMINEFQMWYMTLFQHLTGQGMPPAEFAELFRQIAANSNSTDSTNPAAQFIASGQYRGTPSMTLTALQKLGPAPLSYSPVMEPAVLVPVALGLVRGAQHPAAALLFAQWYVTEGQRIVEKEQFVAQSPDEKDLRGVEMIRADLDDLDSVRLDEWRVAYDNLLRGSGEVLPAYVRSGT